jgi:signal transduction histidine kinase
MEAAEFQQAYGMMPESMLLVSGEGDLRAGNPAACELFSRSQLAGLNLYELAADPKTKLARYLSLCQRNRELLPGSINIRRSDASLLSCRVEGAALAGCILLRLFAKEQATSRFVLLNERIEALHKEIAERQRAEAALRRANTDLQQFAYSASHDLKEPLRMVGVYSQLLQRKYRGKLDLEADEFLAYTVQGAQRMDMLIQDLLTYTQAVSVSEEELTPVSANKPLSEALANLAGAINESSATVRVRGLLPILRVKDVHLLQLFQNVIGNAVKYRSELPPLIEVTAHPEGAMWRICVHDNGIGIAPQYAQQVFGIFRRLHTSEKYPGTGIGLAICQKIVDRYGGRIWVESEGEGCGTAFCFTLPGG